MERMEMMKAVYRLLNVNLFQAKVLIDLSLEYAEGLDHVGDSERLIAIYCINAKDINKLSALIDGCKADIAKDHETHGYGDFCDINTDWRFHIQHAIYYSRIYKHVSCMK